TLCGTASLAEEPARAPTSEERKALEEKRQQLSTKMMSAYHEGHLDEALRWANDVLRTCEQLYPLTTHPDGHPDLAGSINDLGFLLWARGDYARAQPLYERALAMHEKLYSKERFPNGHPDLALSINNLGGLLQARGDYARAQPLYERALAMYE